MRLLVIEDEPSLLKLITKRLREEGYSVSTNIKGILVESVTDGSPAQRAGIRSGDRITEFDGKNIESPYELISLILRHNIGDKVTLSIYRSGQNIELSLVLTEEL